MEINDSTAIHINANTYGKENNINYKENKLNSLDKKQERLDKKILDNENDIDNEKNMSNKDNEESDFSKIIYYLLY